MCIQAQIIISFERFAYLQSNNKGWQGHFWSLTNGNSPVSTTCSWDVIEWNHKQGTNGQKVYISS